MSRSTIGATARSVPSRAARMLVFAFVGLIWSFAFVFGLALLVGGAAGLAIVADDPPSGLTLIVDIAVSLVWIAWGAASVLPPVLETYRWVRRRVRVGR